MSRSKTQIEADEIDCDLYRLMTRAERRHDEATPVDRKKWNDALRAMRSARSSIRQMMHKSDIARTQ